MFGFSIIQTIGAGLLALLLSSGAAYFYGYERGHGQAMLELQAANAKALEAAYDNGRAYQIAEDAASLDVGKKIVEYRDRLQTKTITLTREVPIYVPQSAVRACTINRGAVELLNNASDHSAQAPAVPDPAAGAIGADSHVGLDTVVSIVSSNYAKCNSGFQTVNSWKDWYTKAKAAYDAWAAKSAAK